LTEDDASRGAPPAVSRVTPGLWRECRITTGDYAAAVVDAVESGAFLRQRFTVAY
jgi:hypothetical protein